MDRPHASAAVFVRQCAALSVASGPTCRGLDTGRRGPWQCAGTQGGVSASDPESSEHRALVDLCALSADVSQTGQGS